MTAVKIHRSCKN